MKRLDGIKACVFDAYGTLFDFASAAARCQDVPDQKLVCPHLALAGKAASVHVAAVA